MLVCLLEKSNIKISLIIAQRNKGRRTRVNLNPFVLSVYAVSFYIETYFLLFRPKKFVPSHF